jgi:hypothetical protein
MRWWLAVSDRAAALINKGSFFIYVEETQLLRYELLINISFEFIKIL